MRDAMKAAEKAGKFPKEKEDLTINPFPKIWEMARRKVNGMCEYDRGAIYRSLEYYIKQNEGIEKVLIQEKVKLAKILLEKYEKHKYDAPIQEYRFRLM